MTGLILAVDVGAGSLRVGAIRTSGAAAATVRVPLQADSLAAGWHETDPARWWSALRAAAGQVLDRLPERARVRGVVIGGLTRTQVFVDAHARPVLRAISFRDRRADGEASRLARRFPSDNPADAITAFHPLARIAWVARHRPREFERVDAVLEPREFLQHRLTGAWARDRVTASRLDALVQAPRARDDPMLERCVALLGGAAVQPWAQIGEIATAEEPFTRLAGVPVFAGSMDAWCSAAGAGAVAPGQAYDIAGTSEVVGQVTATRVLAPGLVSLRWTNDAWQIGGPTQAGADCARWCQQIFRVPGRLAAALARAGALPVDPARPIFLPYLAGERTPLWRDDVRGAFHGLDRAHSPDDLLWSVMEGVAQAARDILASARAGGAAPATALRIAGGGARDDAWCQLKANVLGVPVERTRARETGLTGAAMAGAVGLGLYCDIVDAARGMSRVERVFEPDPAHAFANAARAGQYARVKEAAVALADAARTPPDPAGTGHPAGAGAEPPGD